MISVTASKTLIDVNLKKWSEAWKSTPNTDTSHSSSSRARRLPWGGYEWSPPRGCWRPAWHLAPSTPRLGVTRRHTLCLSEAYDQIDCCVPKPPALSFRVWLLCRLRNGHEKGPYQGLRALRILAGSLDCKLR